MLSSIGFETSAQEREHSHLLQEDGDPTRGQQAGTVTLVQADFLFQQKYIAFYFIWQTIFPK